MNTAEWQTWNHGRLVAAVDEARGALERLTGRPSERKERQTPPENDAAENDAVSALESLYRACNLTEFERSLLVLCAAYELDGSVPALCAAANGNPAQSYVCFGLAMAALPDPHWSAFGPSAPLRRLRLIEVGAGPGLTLSPLRIDESTLHFLAGVRRVDERIVRLAHPAAPAPLAPPHQATARLIAATWCERDPETAAFVVQVLGGDADDRRATAVGACAMTGMQGWEMPARALPLDPAERDLLLRLWEREAALHAGCLLLTVTGDDVREPGRADAVIDWLERARMPVAVLSEEPIRLRRLAPGFELAPLDASDRRSLWQSALAESEPEMNGVLEPLLGQFQLSARAIDAACKEARREQARTGRALPELLWEACRGQARLSLDDLAQRITSRSDWDDLILPQNLIDALQDIAAHVRHRVTVYDQWGFGHRGGRGLGLSVLFAGASGTGKTLAAEVLANTLGLDLYKIDLSAMVSKYIGETEKNLRRVFDAAEGSGAILLFDEADALFGKRSDVKDSHDRHANIEVSYLLQRMEAYRGLAILTTNMKGSLDVAFLRRLRFLLDFPFPDASERARIWRRVFPKDAPTDRLDYEKLSRLNVAGGSIWNTAVNAAFFAADAREPIGMAHVLRAARREYAKLEKPLTGAEIDGWVSNL